MRSVVKGTKVKQNTSQKRRWRYFSQLFALRSSLYVSRTGTRLEAFQHVGRLVYTWLENHRHKEGKAASATRVVCGDLTERRTWAITWGPVVEVRGHQEHPSFGKLCGSAGGKPKIRRRNVKPQWAPAAPERARAQAAAGGWHSHAAQHFVGWSDIQPVRHTDA